MAISVKNLQPIGFGIPTHAPKLWRMPATEPGHDLRRSLWDRLALLRRADKLIDELPPLATIRAAD